MSTDRELLELAAKAADVKLSEFARPNELSPDGWGLVRFIGHGHVAFWNPLTDDGDALRLAVKLRIHVEWVKQMGAKDASHVQASPMGAGHLAVILTFDGDAFAATRRAITEASAEIGKATS
jgi:hypothetical protein